MFDFAVNHTYNDNWYIVTQIVHVISPLQLISAKKSALYVRELGQHFADDICKCILHEIGNTLVRNFIEVFFSLWLLGSALVGVQSTSHYLNQ